MDAETELSDSTIINKRISVVALYEEEMITLSEALTYMTDENEHETEKNAVLGREIKQTVSGATKWYRDGRLVAYGDTYRYFVWDPTGITLTKAMLINKKPIVLLDDPVEEAYMIEYDEGDGTALEAGILFGASDEISINSCYSKAKTQKIAAHGQFGAKPASGDSVSEGMQEFVRGYLVYRDCEGVIRVKYTDAVKIS